MAGLLLPGMPGGSRVAVVDRAAYVAGHPWAWRAGWLAWQVTAPSDLLLAVAMVATPWVPPMPAVLVLMLTAATLVPDQYGQWLWTWPGVRLAAAGPVGYAAFESHALRLVAGWGSVGYTAAALCWTWAFAAAGTWARWLSCLSVATWGMFAAATAVLFWPGRPPAWVAGATSVGNAVAFVLLLAWLAGVTEYVLRRARPAPPWHHPSSRLADGLANSRLVWAIGHRLPFVPLASDVTDAVYANYLVPADRLAPLVAPGLTLQRVGDGLAVFTVLTFRHGHFGPRWLGPLRQLCPSPVQSNWRVYVTHPPTGQSGVQFITTAITASVGAIVARATSDGVAMHVPATAAIDLAGESVVVRLEPGRGSAPDFSADLHAATSTRLPTVWTAAFASWADLLAYVVPQDRAFAPQLVTGRIGRQDITLTVDWAACRPLAGRVVSAAAAAVVGDAQPACFGVRRVGFAYTGSVRT